MRSRKFDLFFLLIINFYTINGQSEDLKCEYSQSNYNGYSCNLIIQNPNGLNNFQDINGAHIDGKTDNDVSSVTFAYYSVSPNIPSVICEKFKNLGSFENGIISEVNDYSFKNCSELEIIRVVGSNLKKINKNAFSENLQLHSLTICYTELTTLPVYVFPKSGNNLIHLDLSHNKLNNLKLEWFRTLKNLQSINLDNNEIEEIPINIFVPLINLKTFTINFNRLAVLSANSFYDVSILYISFNDNLLDAIDEKFLNQTESFYNKFNNNHCLAADRNSFLTISHFKKCIENYRAWETGCILGNTPERVCQIESNIGDFQIKINTKIDTLMKENQDLKSKMDVMVIGFQAMQNQINLLSNRP